MRPWRRLPRLLGWPSDQLDFEVLDQGSTGFLGIGARDARILVANATTQAECPSYGGEEDRPLEHAGDGGAEPAVEEESARNYAGATCADR
jgi:hypothetical protein